MSFRILVGDVCKRLAELPDESFQCVVTSPPYFGLRDYGVAGQIGLEKTPQEFVAKLVDVFREVRRVLRSDGTCWLNLGDSYAGSWGAQSRGNTTGEAKSRLSGSSMLSARQIEAHPLGATSTGSLKNTPGLKKKDLMGIPWRLAFALQDDGWWLRQDIIWSKPNPMPESVNDRCTKAHEYLFLLSRSEHYYYDADAIREPSVKGAAGSRFHDGNTAVHQLGRSSENEREERDTRNKRSVWTVSTQGYEEAHFATFPPKLIEPCILAGSREGDLVGDPFSGAGTTGLVCQRLGRDYLGVELNPEYAEMSELRLHADQPLFAKGKVVRA